MRFHVFIRLIYSPAVLIKAPCLQIDKLTHNVIYKVLPQRDLQFLIVAKEAD